MSAGHLGTLVVLATLSLSCEESFDVSPPPGSCSAGERVCYHEPRSGRELLLRCNDGEVDGAIWLIAEVCLDGATCQVDRCVAPGGLP